MPQRTSNPEAAGNTGDSICLLAGSPRQESFRRALESPELGAGDVRILTEGEMGSLPADPSRALVAEAGPEILDILEMDVSQPTVVVADGDLAGRAGRRLPPVCVVLDWDADEPGALVQAVLRARERFRVCRALAMAHGDAIARNKCLQKEHWYGYVMQMIGVLAHEVNQPLTSLLGHIDLLLMSPEDPEKVERHVGKLEHTGERIAEVVMRLQEVRHEKAPDVPDLSSFEKGLTVLFVGKDGPCFKKALLLLKAYPGVRVDRCEDPFARLEETPDGYDLILCDRGLDRVCVDRLIVHTTDCLQQGGRAVPVLVAARMGEEERAYQKVREGASGYVILDGEDGAGFLRSLLGAWETARIREGLEAARKMALEMAIKDDLTQVSNRSYFIRALEKELDQDGSSGSVCMAMISVDSLPDLNAKYTETAGDFVLRFTAETLKKYMGSQDLACRYDGNVFALCQCKVPVERCRDLMEEFVRRVRGETLTWFGRLVPLTVSVGMVSYDASKHGDSASLLDAAERALEKACKAGGDRVVLEE